ncbi:MAG: PIN domain-containing protein [Sporichthyaceae bacterium]
MTISVVLADANILFSRTLRDYFLHLADAGAIEIHWSQQILDEMSRNLRKRIGLDQSGTDRLEELMNNYIEYALITVDPGDLASVADVAMDANDRHVLAAALSAEADVLLTDNTAHFPSEWLAEHHIALFDSATLLTRLAETFPDKLVAAHRRTVRLSRKSEAEVLSTLAKITGKPIASTIRSLAIGPP